MLNDEELLEEVIKEIKIMYEQKTLRLFAFEMLAFSEDEIYK